MPPLIVVFGRFSGHMLAMDRLTPICMWVGRGVHEIKILKRHETTCNLISHVAICSWEYVSLR